MKVKISSSVVPEYPAGSMFWFRPQALNPLINLGLKYEDFEAGSENQNDGTLAHAVERLFCVAVNKSGFSCRQVRYRATSLDSRLPISPEAVDSRLVARLKRRVAVVLHLYYTDLIDEIASYLQSFSFPFDLWVTTPHKTLPDLEKFLSQSGCKGRVRVVTTANRGYDIGPFITEVLPKLAKYDYVLKIHGKKSLYNPGHADWRGYLFHQLVGNQEIVETTLSYFEMQPDLGIVMPKTYSGVDTYNLEDPWRNNWLKAKELADLLSINLVRERSIDFPSGSMFWFRPAALKPLLDLGLTIENFAEGGNKLDGTYAHAIERLFVLVANKAGYQFRTVEFEE
jgi:lipopolysaccharide biosynthesis protein